MIDLERIRESEEKSHTKVYMNEKLYDTNTWLKKPIKTLDDIISLFTDYDDLNVLDLGCGVGRNCIYIASAFKHIKVRIDCVDLLSIAINKLEEYAKEYDVVDSISGKVGTIEDYNIINNYYDLIIAVSSLEHVDSENNFVRKLEEIKEGLKNNGVACFVINTNVKEVNRDTKQLLEPQFEVNLETNKVRNYLAEIFYRWELLKDMVVRQEYDTPRDGFTSHITSQVLTYVVRRNM